MRGGGERGTLSDENAPDPPDKFQAMERDLVGLGWGREVKLEGGRR